VFDCRIIYNPGRHDEYKKLTGRDEAVKNYIEQHTIMPQFLHHTKALVNEGVKTYIERGFDSLQINFGCTGGQHRSVFAADAIAKHLKEKFGVQVVLHHIEQEKKNWIN
jgi:RNase adaptor protein for sRNA GlmZ degradation